MDPKERLTGLFQSTYASIPLVFQSPGRINLIGEHTDYNGGWVMPAGIDKACYLAILPLASGPTEIWAYDLQDRISVNAFPEKSTTKHWSNYIFGVCLAFSRRGVKVPHFQAIVSSDIPVGAGLSSSAALESVFAYALNAITGAGFDGMELAHIAREAENVFVGLQCGIMDMFASIHARKDHAIKLDCRSLDFDYVPLQLGENKIVLFDTCLKHDLASSAYNERRQQCESVVDALRQKGLPVETLRDANMQDLLGIKGVVDPVALTRARFVLNENDRVSGFADAMDSGNWALAGEYLFASHQGLKDEYNVSCAELDFLVEAVRGQPGVWGGRMMGGGFGGCTINIVADAEVENLVAKTSALYANAYGVAPKHYIATTGDGACAL
jgi:galactokinase